MSFQVMLRQSSAVSSASPAQRPVQAVSWPTRPSDTHNLDSPYRLEANNTPYVPACEYRCAFSGHGCEFASLDHQHMTRHYAESGEDHANMTVKLLDKLTLDNACLGERVHKLADRVDSLTHDNQQLEKRVLWLEQDKRHLEERVVASEQGNRILEQRLSLIEQLLRQPGNQNPDAI